MERIIKLNKDRLESLCSSKGGWNYSVFKHLGVYKKDPPTKGWKSLLLNKKISLRTYLKCILDSENEESISKMKQQITKIKPTLNGSLSDLEPELINIKRDKIKMLKKKLQTIKYQLKESRKLIENDLHFNDCQYNSKKLIQEFIEIEEKFEKVNKKIKDKI